MEHLSFNKQAYINTMNLPIGITMGCPSGIGPETILKYCKVDPSLLGKAVILGDLHILTKAGELLQTDIKLNNWQPGAPLASDQLNVLPVSDLSPSSHKWGEPDLNCGIASASYIETGVKLIQDNILSGLVTCPISKAVINSAGYNFPGHTEMLAHLTNSKKVVMMMAGPSLRVTLATIHCSFAEVPVLLDSSKILELIRITNNSLRIDFSIDSPKIAVAALNPHAGEDKLFGDEEETIITPAIQDAQVENIKAEGPFPADTLFYKAVKGEYDAVVCMYHDQGLIPFKLLHFEDGVNITLGLPIVRTSVDHGTAYDIAGKGIAESSSLQAATELAQTIVTNRKRNN